ncbi:MAG: dephospho-CoA kinase [Planctomycetota bacterium]|nr:dephospho-CoA kinase [Planctomycetota bacterium]
MKRLRDTNYGTGNPAGEGLGGRRREKRTDRRRSRKAPTRPIRVLGIVGGMGSGKSRIAKMLAVRGATVIDADAVGHALLDQGPVQEALVRKFGTDILGPDLGDGTRQIDRRALGAIVFSNEAARKALEESLHPRMRTTFERVISRLSRQVSPKPGSLRLPAPIVVLDAALLYEAGWNDLCDMVVFVDAPRKDRIKRVKLQRDWSPDEMDLREASQWPLELKKNQSQLVIRNPDSENETVLEKEVDRIWSRINPAPKPAASSIPKPKPVVPDYSHLIEDEIEELSPEQPRQRRSGGRPPRPSQK